MENARIYTNKTKREQMQKQKQNLEHKPQNSPKIKQTHQATNKNSWTKQNGGYDKVQRVAKLFCAAIRQTCFEGLDVRFRLQKDWP